MVDFIEYRQKFKKKKVLATKPAIDTAKRKLERLQFSTSSSFVKI